jgi:hypothetical protein
MSDALGPVTTAQAVVFKAVKLACLKAVGVMMSNNSNIAKNCLCAALIADRVFKHYDVNHAVVAGYTQIEGTNASFPHVWMETVVEHPDGPRTYVTDLTFSGPYRTIIILGTSIGFNDDAQKPTFTTAPMYDVPVGSSVPLETLRAVSTDLEKYLSNAPKFVKTAVAAALEKAFDGSDSITLEGVSEQLLGAGTVKEAV